MTHLLPTQTRRLPTIGMAFLLSALWGCAGGPGDKTDIEPPPVEVKPIELPTQSLALPPTEFSAQFRSAETALAQADWMSAELALQDIPLEQMSVNDSIYLEYLQARIAWTRGDQPRAMATLARLDYPGMNPGLHYRILNFQRHMLDLSGDYLASARMGDRIFAMAPPSEGPALRRGIWRDLQRLPRAELESALATAADSQWRGWLQLALATRDDPGGRTTAVSNWRTEHPAHPAAVDLPGGLGYQLDASEQLDKVALLLPLSGRLAPAGKAVRDGYLASYYAAQGRGASGPELLVLDMDTYDSALTAYNEAMVQGAALVIGPLSKQAVSELGTRPERPVPVLALNRVEQLLPATGSALVQLSLAPEDEAQRIADIAFGQGARSALIIRPAGDWGSKMENALRQRWAELGARVANSVSYSSREDYSPSVKSALDLDTSEKRAQDIRSMLATNIEFTARRRQDIDTIFLLSRSGAEARSIKPLLAFHYAASVPVFSTSSIYSGIPDSRDRDLDGINLVETPWLLGASPGLRVAIAAGGTGSDNYTRLNALGADAYLLQSNFNRLQAGPDALLRGNTGLLDMNPQLHIQRELPLATFDGGDIKPR